MLKTHTNTLKMSATTKGPKPCPNEGPDGKTRCTYKICGNIHVNPSSKAYIKPNDEISCGDCKVSTNLCPNEGTDGKTRCTFKNCGCDHVNPTSKAYKTLETIKSGGSVQSSTYSVISNEGNDEEKNDDVDVDFVYDDDEDIYDDLNNAFIQEEEYTDDELYNKIYGEIDAEDDICKEFLVEQNMQEMVGHWIPECRTCTGCNGFPYGEFDYSLCSTCF